MARRPNTERILATAQKIEDKIAFPKVVAEGEFNYYLVKNKGCVPHVKDCFFPMSAAEIFDGWLNGTAVRVTIQQIQGNLLSEHEKK